MSMEERTATLQKDTSRIENNDGLSVQSEPGSHVCSRNYNRHRGGVGAPCLCLELAMRNDVH